MTKTNGRSSAEIVHAIGAEWRGGRTSTVQRGPGLVEHWALRLYRGGAGAGIDSERLLLPHPHPRATADPSVDSRPN